MEEEGEQRENRKCEANQYKSVYSQHKENQTIKLIMAERDKAIQERDLALAEKKTALVERDMAHLQRDAAIAERNIAIVERDNAFAALEYARENCMTSNCFHACTCSRGLKHVYHHQQHHIQHIHSSQQQLDSSYNQTRDVQGFAFSTSTVAENGQKNHRVKRSRKEIKTEVNMMKSVKSRRKSKLSVVENLDKQVTVATTAKRRCDGGVAGDLNDQVPLKKHREWKNQDLEPNIVVYDESTIPVPVCSCTGKYQQCYKWGNGGWQSACCTTTLSMHPLPLLPNKRHARVGGRKMSGSAFQKLLSRLAAEGLDLSMPVDLKDHWAKHGTNRYITIK